MENIYAEIAARTGGSIYIGVSGPVRTGKSTLIKGIMEKLVIPNISDPYRAQRARDELPQCGSGKTIMTSEPKFVPEEAVEISPDGSSRLSIRMIDSVGYMIPGAAGAEEDGQPRMVTTPWFDYEIPLTQAAELGTQKVMQDHSSVGLVVTTDGTVADIPREDYVEAERRAIRDMQKTGKPFLVVVNSRDPEGPEARAVGDAIYTEHQIKPVITDCQSLDEQALTQMLQALLYSFPIEELQVFFPRWMDTLANDHPVKAKLYETLLRCAGSVQTLGQAESCLEPLKGVEAITSASLRSLDPGTGIAAITLAFPEQLFYDILSTTAGIPIADDADLMEVLSRFAALNREYAGISDALASVKATGYGVVMPTAQEMTLETPEVIKKGSSYGVRLRASAPSIHMLRVDIDTEISPMVGDQQQSQDLIAFLSGEDPDALWQSNLFGKSVNDLIQEGLTAKLVRTPQDVREKLRNSLSKVVNEGANGLICLIL